MRKISILELIEWTYGPESKLARDRKWWGGPKHSVQSLEEALSKDPRFQAFRYPSGKIFQLRGPEEVTKEMIEEIALRD